jgi:hypothetical protein
MGSAYDKQIGGWKVRERREEKRGGKFIAQFKFFLEYFYLPLPIKPGFYFASVYESEAVSHRILVRLRSQRKLCGQQRSQAFIH